MKIARQLTRRGRPQRTLFLSVAALAGALVAQGFVPDAVFALTPAEQYRAEFVNHAANAPIMAVSHLGAWRNAPEDSLQAIEDAVALNVPVTELDLWKTSDNQLVVMHDDSVNRTTNGTGSIASKTLAQIKSLRLRELRGGSSAAVTTMQVPTLAEALAVAKDRILVNLDKSWNMREDVYAAVAAAGMQSQVIFKSNAAVSQVNAFLTAHPDVLYCHIIDDGNVAAAHSFVREPDCYEVTFDQASDAQAQPAYLAGLRSGSRVWMNTLWKGLAGNFTDEASFQNIMNGWGGVAALGANLIQTDHPAALQHWIAGGSPGSFDLQPGAVRVYARDYAFGGEGVAYHDIDAANVGGVYRTTEGVDVCDQEGAIDVCWIRGGEWIKYSVLIPSAGDYAVKARVSTPYNPAGSFTMEFPGWTTGSVAVRNTTSHTALLMQNVTASHHFDAGTTTFIFRVGTTGTQNYNLDYFQFDRL